MALSEMMLSPYVFFCCLQINVLWDKRGDCGRELNLLILTLLARSSMKFNTFIIIPFSKWTEGGKKRIRLMVVVLLCCFYFHSLRCLPSIMSAIFIHHIWRLRNIPFFFLRHLLLCILIYTLDRISDVVMMHKIKNNSLP